MQRKSENLTMLRTLSISSAMKISFEPDSLHALLEELCFVIKFNCYLYKVSLGITCKTFLEPEGNSFCTQDKCWKCLR